MEHAGTKEVSQKIQDVEDDLPLAGKLEQEEEHSEIEDIVEEDEEETAWSGSQIISGLWLGSISDATNHQALIEHTITVLISVHDDAQNVPKDPVSQVRFWCADRSDANLLEIMDPAADAVAASLKQGANILVHCLEGRSRSSSVVCAYLMKYRNLSLREAFALVKQKRDIAEPNRGFWRQLAAFERYIHGSESLSEEQLPGCVMFEQDVLDRMISDFELQVQQPIPKRARIRLPDQDPN